MKYLFVIVLAYLADVGQGVPTNVRINIRRSASISDVPYVAQIRDTNGTFLCCGAIFNFLYILTTASCVHDAATGDLVVAVGTSELDGGTEYTVRSIISHEEYDPSDEISQHDIAMVKLGRYLRYGTEVRPIAAPELYEDDSVEEGSIVTVAGWDGSPTVKKISQVVVSPGECREAYSNVTEADITDEFICSETVASDNDEHGDQGSPLVDGRMLVGLKLKTVEGKPDIYTRIRPHLEWLDENNTDY